MRCSSSARRLARASASRSRCGALPPPAAVFGAARFVPARRQLGPEGRREVVGLVFLADAAGAEPLGELGVDGRGLEQRPDPVDHRRRQGPAAGPGAVADEGRELGGGGAMGGDRGAQGVTADLGGVGGGLAQLLGRLEPARDGVGILAGDVVERPRRRRRLGSFATSAAAALLPSLRKSFASRLRSATKSSSGTALSCSIAASTSASGMAPFCSTAGLGHA